MNVEGKSKDKKDDIPYALFLVALRSFMAVRNNKKHINVNNNSQNLLLICLLPLD